MSAWPLAKELATVSDAAANVRAFARDALGGHAHEPREAGTLCLQAKLARYFVAALPVVDPPEVSEGRPVRRHGLAHARAGGIDDLAAGQLHLAEEQGVLATGESEGGVEAEIERAHRGSAHQGVVGRGGGEFRAVAQRRARARTPLLRPAEEVAVADPGRRAFREDRHHGAAHHVGPGARLCAQQLLEPVQLGDLVVVDHGEEFGIPRHVIQAGIARVRNAAAGLLDVAHRKPGRRAGLRADRCGFAAALVVDDHHVETRPRHRREALRRQAAEQRAEPFGPAIGAGADGDIRFGHAGGRRLPCEPTSGASSARDRPWEDGWL